MHAIITCTAILLPTLLHTTTPGPIIGTMTASTPSPFDVDPEFAQSLLNLPMAVPEYWWPGFKGRKLLHGKIKAVSPRDPDLKIFQLELEDEPGVLYGMRYDAVAMYANVEHDDFAQYLLPVKPPIDPQHEPTVAARTGHAPPRRTISSKAKPVSAPPAKRARALADRTNRVGGRADDEVSTIKTQSRHSSHDAHLSLSLI